MDRTEHCRASHGPNPARDANGYCSACRRERKCRERAEHRALLERLQGGRSCERCGSRDELRFHYRAPGAHTYRPARGGNAIVYMVRWGTDRLLEEVAKCEVLCSWCHTLHHHPHLGSTNPGAKSPSAVRR